MFQENVVCGIFYIRMLKSIVPKALEKSTNTDNLFSPHFIALSIPSFILKSKVMLELFLKYPD